jgi:hypothetical protein
MTLLNVSRAFPGASSLSIETACSPTQIASHQIHLVQPCLLASFSLASYNMTWFHCTHANEHHQIRYMYFLKEVWSNTIAFATE